jgi:hypothetical protein
MVEADWVESATLTAVMITVCWEVIVDGAEYRPPDVMLPTPDGTMVQVTLAFVVLLTVAVSCCVWLAVSEAFNGVKLIDTGKTGVPISETVALALCV